jgi:hypothetical protein
VDVYVTGNQCQGTPTSEKVDGDNFCYEKMQIKCVSGQGTKFVY